jgi:hypothetical protein
MMMKMSSRAAMVAAAGIMLGSISIPAFAQQSQSSEQNEARSADAQASQANNRRVCVREDGVASRMAHRVCHTVREWQALGGVPQTSNSQ